ncbi:MAG: SDR family NAD(P)-dependent oxidoreductase, partial [Burkholderiales bacterium]
MAEKRRNGSTSVGGNSNGNGKNGNGNGHPTTRLSGKVAIITGAGRGIGHATALKFGREGAIVIAADINADQAQQAAKDVTEAGGEALGYQIDVRDPASIARMVAAVVAKYGRIDCLVNNAGIVQDSTLKNMT